MRRVYDRAGAERTSPWRRFFDNHAPKYEENVFTKNTLAEVVVRGRRQHRAHRHGEVRPAPARS